MMFRARFLLAGLAFAIADTVSAPALAPPPEIQTCFVPGRVDCSALIISTIAAARSEILVQAYGFTSAPIADALAAAERRGVAVKAILDRRDVHGRGSRIGVIGSAGVPVLIDSVPGIAHNKVMVLDDATVITGSYNFTDSAQRRNAENVVIIHDQGTADAFRDNWRARAGESHAPSDAR